MNKLGIILLVASMATVGAASPTLGQHKGPGMMDKDVQDQKMMRCGMMGKEGKAEGQDMMGCRMMGGQGRGMMHSRPMMEARLAYIKTDLDITEAQTEAWDVYADAVRARQAAMKDVHSDMMEAANKGTASERIDAQIKATETKLNNLKALEPAIEALYTVLTDNQKKKANKLLSGGCPMMSGQ